MASVLQEPLGIGVAMNMVNWVRGVGILSASFPGGAGSVVVAVYNPQTASMTLRWSTDRLNFPVIGTFACSAGHFSMTVGPDNSIYCVMQTTAGGNTVTYRKITWNSGTSWTVGAAESVYVQPSGFAIGKRDIEILDNGVVAIALLESNSTTDIQRVHLFVRNTGAVWVDTLVQSVTTSSTQNGHMLSICRGPAASGGFQKVFMAYGLTGVSDGELSSERIEQATGLVDQHTLISGVLANGGITGSAMLFNDGTKIIVGAYTQGTANAMVVNASTGAIITPRTSSPFSHVSGAGSPGPSFAYLNGRLVAIGRENNNGIRVSTKVCDLSVDGVATWYPSVANFNEAMTPSVSGGETASSYVTWAYSGANRNLDQNKLDVVTGEDVQARVMHEYRRTPPHGDNYVPLAGTVFTTDQPVFRQTLNAPTSSTLDAGQMSAMPSGPWVQFYRKGIWKITTDGGSANLRTLEEPNTDWLLTGQATETPTGPLELFQGEWIAEPGVVDQLGLVRMRALGFTFTVSHPPSSTGHSPTGGGTVTYGVAGVPLQWVPSDSSPTDAMTAYQILVIDTDTGSQIVDTGKVPKAGELGVVQSVNIVLGAPNKDRALQWRIRLWDNDDVAGAYSGLQAFRASDPPGTTIISPTDGGTMSSPAPTITWQNTLPANRLQASRRVSFYVTDQVDEDGNPFPVPRRLVHESGRGVTSSTSYTPSSSVLTNNYTYDIVVEITDNIGLTTTDEVSATLVFTPPTAPPVVVQPEVMAISGYVPVTWTNQGLDSEFYAYRVYRREVGSIDWVLLAEEREIAPAYEFRDWLAGSGVSYQWVVAQVATRFGSQVESVYEAAGGQPVSEDYWLIDIFDEAVNVRLNHVTADDYSEEYEMATMNLIGRGRYVEYGTRWGYTGSLSAQIRDETSALARTQKMKLEYLKSLRRSLFLRNPFGDVWEVAPGDIQVSRMAGVGQREFVDVTLPYAEVGSAEVPAVEYTGGAVASVTRDEVQQLIAAEAEARATSIANLEDQFSSSLAATFAGHDESASPHATAKFVKAKGTAGQFGIWNQAADPGAEAVHPDLWAQ